MHDLVSTPLSPEYPQNGPYIRSASNDALFSTGHVLSDEDSEDEHDHESVVTSLLNKYNPRKPFDTKEQPIVYNGKTDRKTKEKLDRLTSPTKTEEKAMSPIDIPKLGIIYEVKSLL